MTTVEMLRACGDGVSNEAADKIEALVAACEAAMKRHERALAIRVKLTGIRTGGVANEIAALKAAIAKGRS